MKTSFKLLWLVLVLSACNEKNTVSTESEKLNALLNKTTIQQIDLDQFPVDTVYAERFIHFRSLDLERQGVFMGRVVSLKNTDDYFYVINDEAPFIVQFDKDGNYLQKIGRRGEGPQEYLHIQKVAKNKNHFYLMDAGNVRINVYDHAMNYQTTFSRNDIAYGMHISDMIADSENIFFQNVDDKPGLIRTVSTDSLSETTDTFLPRLIPVGMQPQPVNHHFGDINESKNMAIVYLGLPYIVFFDSAKEPKSSIVLTSSNFENKIPSLEPTNTDGSNIGVAAITSFVKWIDEEHFIIENSNVLSVVKKSGNEFEVQGRYKVEYASKEEAKKHKYGLNLRVVDFDERFMYITSPHDNGVYRFPLTELGL